MAFNQLFRKKTIAQILDDSHLGEAHSQHLHKNLGLIDLTGLGIAAIIGAGIFSTIGNASADGGPAVSLLFVFTAIACAFSAMCYSEFASRIPISGSAYTYSYAAFGEFIAWIIGWDLLMEYAVGNIAVAISWSKYFTSLLEGFGINVPLYLTMDFLSATRFHEAAAKEIASGHQLSTLAENLREGYMAFEQAPRILNMPIICDLPAFTIVVLISILVYVGIRESKFASNAMVALKLAVILMVIAVGVFYIKPENWSPFAPNGVGGVLKGVAAVFFAYIGFDAISTTAEECKNPQKDLPRAMFLSLIICTILYVLICFVLTGMVNYKDLAVADPLMFAFQARGISWISGIIGVSAIIAMASVLLVFQVGQPRIWMSMSRDGLLPKKFATIHPRFKTPSFSTVVTGFFVAIPTLFMNLTEVTDLTSIGTLFAFVLVCSGILFLEPPSERENIKSKYRVPYINGKYLVPALLLLSALAVWYFNAEGVRNFFVLNAAEKNDGWLTVRDKIPTIIFLAIAVIVSIITFLKSLSAIPVIGLLINLYLMSELGYTNWLRFLIWLIVGLCIYFLYGYNHSKLKDKGR